MVWSVRHRGRLEAERNTGSRSARRKFVTHYRPVRQFWWLSADPGTLWIIAYLPGGRQRSGERILSVLAIPEGASLRVPGPTGRPRSDGDPGALGGGQPWPGRGARACARVSAALGSRTIPRHVRAQRIEIDKDGATETVTYTETAQVDCPTCAGSGQGVDFDG